MSERRGSSLSVLFLCESIVLQAIFSRLSSVLEPEVSPVILLDQSEVFKHDLSCFFIRNI